MSACRVDILMITYNRAQYTRLTLQRLLDSCDESMRVWVWQNGLDPDTVSVVKSFSAHPNLHRLEISAENRKLRVPTNWFWSQSNASYLSKVDDDGLLPNGWAQTLLAAHEANADLGIVGCWRYYEEDFLPEVARPKLFDLSGGHRLLANAWIEGSGYVMKRACMAQAGFIRERESFTGYCVRTALLGWRNGWYYPFIHQEHMDDPRSEYCGILTEEDFQRQRPLSAVNHDVRTLDEWKRRVRHMAHVVQAAPLDPRMHSGWRARASGLHNRLKRFIGVREPWQVGR